MGLAVDADVFLLSNNGQSILVIDIVEILNIDNRKKYDYVRDTSVTMLLVCFPPMEGACPIRRSSL